MAEMGLVEGRIRMLMDSGKDFTNLTPFRKAYSLMFGVGVDSGSVKRYGMKYQNELEEKGGPMPWKGVEGQHEDEDEEEKAGERVKIADSLTAIAAVVEEVEGYMHYTDMMDLLDAIECIGLNRFRTVYKFINDMKNENPKDFR